MVRIGIIGVGGIGCVHAGFFEKDKVSRGELVAVCDIDPKKLERERFKNLKQFADSKDLIRSGEVDAVIIGTPHYAHTTIGIDALEQGLHVLVEKPISVHKADAERLIAAHKDKSQVFAAMFNERTVPHYKQVKKLVASGELGEIQRINWIITNWFRTETYYSSGGWRATWKGEGGGVLLNQCPHNLDMYQWLFGMPTKVRAFCALGKYHNIEVEDEVTAYMEHPNGATGVFISSTGEAPGTNRLEIAGDRGKVVVEGGKVRFVRNDVSAREFCRTSELRFGLPGIWDIDIPVDGTAGQHCEVIQKFVDAIIDGTPLIANAEEGLRSVELANAMLYSSFTGQTIDLPIDGEEYEKKLKELIASSTFEKKVTKGKTDDMQSSF